MGQLIYSAKVSEIESMALAETGLILLVLGALAYLAVRVRFSVVPFYLALGLALGEGGIFPLSLSETFLTTGAQLGAILLLLMLGLEHSGPNLVAAFLERKSIALRAFRSSLENPTVKKKA
jgi:CPA2 family monovalent cation:H+ antiporter-2